MTHTLTQRTAMALAATLLLATTIPAAAEAQARGSARGARVNADGGISAGAVRARGNGQGQGVVRARGIYTDGAGNAEAGSAGCASGYSGTACRGSRTSVGADGSVYRRSGAHFETDTASGSTYGEFNRNADGSYYGRRDTSVSGANGNYDATTTVDSATGLNRSATASNENGSVDVQSQYQQGSGGSRTVTCYDAYGNQVACPK
ncbi:MAG: hypothetical protein CMH94_08130 [Oceanicaulis sp.]|nr:hypothetical protein [Maricaulis sp.]MBI75554.1 hypothetical protein [Oceanicaulis sp.]